MRAVLQRVRDAKVVVEGETIGAIGRGWLILLGVGHEDGPDDLQYIADKCLNLRAFADAEGKMNRSILDVRGEMLVVSQFTLYGDCRKGRRPSFTPAASPEIANRTYEDFCERMRQAGIQVATGSFGAHMEVSLCNDGPVTFVLDSSKIL